MKLNKILIYMLLGLFMLSSASAISTTGLKAYYKMNGNSTDSLGAFDGTDTSVTYTSGIINLSANFSSSTSSEVDIGIPYEINSGEFTFSFWINTVDSSTNSWLIENRNGGASANRFYVAMNDVAAGETNILHKQRRKLYKDNFYYECC